MHENPRDGVLLDGDADAAAPQPATPEPAAPEPVEWPEVASAEFWEERYAASERIWSGRVNRVLADVASQLEPRRALDIGCGEGADAIWLALRGWRATGLDVSATAVARAAEAARATGLDASRARFLAGDIVDLAAAGERFELVTASFLHSPAGRSREEILRLAAGLVEPGGHLLVTSHAAAPPWSGSDRSRGREHGSAHEVGGARDDGPVFDDSANGVGSESGHGHGSGGHAHAHRFPTPAEDIAALDLDPDAWEVEVAEVRRREATGPDGAPAVLDDGVVLLRRR